MKIQMNINRFNIKTLNIKTPLFFFFICWILMSIEFTAFYVKFNYFSLYTNAFIGIIDSIVILWPYLLLRPKWRLTVVIPMLLVPICLLADLLYQRNFIDVMTVRTMFEFNNLTDLVITSAVASLQKYDLWFLIPTIVFLTIYILYFRIIKQGSFSLKIKISGILLTITLFVCQQSFFQSAIKKDGEKIGEPIHTSWFKTREMMIDRDYRILALRWSGFPTYWCMGMYKWLKPMPQMDASEREDISRILELNTKNAKKPLIIDSLPSNTGKNLIFILVESFNSDGLRVRVNGRPAMPFTSELISMPDVFVADNVSVQVGDGRSSDGRFMYNTGLLPDLSTPVAMGFADVDYPSLPNSLGLPGTEFDCGDPEQWNLSKFSRSTGYSKLHARESMSKDIARYGGSDAALFTNSLRFIKQLHQPFAIELNTMDMHDPYEKFEWKRSDVWKDKSLSQSEKVYVEKLRQFDTALKNFIEALKREGLYERSVIVIAGDHNARETMLVGKKFTGREIPFIILNSGLGIKTHAPVAQVDLFPTILDIMGKPDARWRGFGTSLLRNPAVMDTTLNRVPLKDPYSYPSAEDWELSKRMINGGFFNTK